MALTNALPLTSGPKPNNLVWLRARAPYYVDTDFAGALAEFGLHRTNAPLTPVVIDGPTALDGRPCDALRARPRTHDIDVFKRWIGVPDVAIRSGIFARPTLLPEIPAQRLDRAFETLTQSEVMELRKAANAYLFDDSRNWLAYRDVVTRHFAPFHVVVYVYDTLVVASGGTLRIDQSPAVLIVDELVIHEGACLDVSTTARLILNHVHTTA